MKCEEYFVLLCGHLDGMNNTEEERKLQKHLESCEECRVLLSQMKENDAALREMQPIPSDLTKKIMQRVRKEPKQRKKAYWDVLATGFKVAAVLAVVLLGGNLLRAQHVEEKSMAAPARCAEVATEEVCIAGAMLENEGIPVPEAMETGGVSDTEPTIGSDSKIMLDEFFIMEGSGTFTIATSTANGMKTAEKLTVLFVYASEVKELGEQMPLDITMETEVKESLGALATENVTAYRVSHSLLLQIKEAYPSEYFEGSAENCIVLVIPNS